LHFNVYEHQTSEPTLALDDEHKTKKKKP